MSRLCVLHLTAAHAVQTWIVDSSCHTPIPLSTLHLSFPLPPSPQVYLERILRKPEVEAFAEELKPHQVSGSTTCGISLHLADGGEVSSTRGGIIS